MGPLELCRLLGRRLLQHQHLDDLILHGRRGSVLVAGVALRLDRLLHRRCVRVSDRAHWRDLPHRLPGRVARQLRHLGCSLARLQSCCHGVCVVRCTGVHWRRVCSTDDPRHLVILGSLKPSVQRHDEGIWHQRGRLRVFPAVLDC